MDEYIEREAFKSEYLCCGYLPEMSEEEFDRFPTIDAVVVTRCKDCRYFKMYKCRMGYSSYNDFCSYGEPKEGNND